MSGGKQFGKLEQFWGFPAQSIGGCVCAHTYIQTFRVFARSASLSLKESVVFEVVLALWNVYERPLRPKKQQKRRC
ncbi:hypothetical protein ACET3Z_017903 [Daucus carota]